MKYGSHLANQAVNNLTTNQQTGSPIQPTPSKATRADADLVNKIFAVLTTKCTGWQQAISGNINQWEGAYKRELLGALIRKGIVEWSWIERGLALVTPDFLPNPERFAQSCRPKPEDEGLPSAIAAYREAARNIGQSPEWRKWSHPAVFHAACEVGFSFIKTEDEKRSWPDFEKAYEGVFRRVLAGENLELPRLEKEVQKRPLSKKENSNRCKSMIKDLGLL